MLQKSVIVFLSVIFLKFSFASSPQLLMPAPGRILKGFASIGLHSGDICTLEVLKVEPELLLVKVQSPKLGPVGRVFKVAKIEINQQEIYTDLETVKRVLIDQAITIDASIIIRSNYNHDGLVLSLNESRRISLLCHLPLDLDNL